MKQLKGITCRFIRYVIQGFRYSVFFPLIGVGELNLRSNLHVRNILIILSYTPPRLNQGLVILSLFLVSIFFSTTPSPCIKGYTGYVESSLFNLLLVRLGQNEHPKSLLVSMTFAHASDLTCNK